MGRARIDILRALSDISFAAWSFLACLFASLFCDWKRTASCESARPSTK
jgi:hypothetical protein